MPAQITISFRHAIDIFFSVGGKLPPLAKKMASMSLQQTAPQILVQTNFVETLLNVPNLDTNFVNPEGYGELHYASTYLGFTNCRVGAQACLPLLPINVAFNTQRPFTWDPVSDKILEGYHGYLGGEHWAFSTESTNFTQLSQTQRNESGVEVVQSIGKYVGGTTLYGHKYLGNLCVQGAAQKTGRYELHKIQGIKFDGIRGATLDMVASAMDGIVGLEPNLQDPQADFIRQVAQAQGGRTQLICEHRLSAVVMEKRKCILGEEHPDTLTSMANLTATYWKMGQLSVGDNI
ncbi:hypothetical protein B0H11DRAFT_1932177 [Mycena galericulata]|nr:hypothetical protein B0H11DRAFT_1932177 [Mycena galericulata]